MNISELLGALLQSGMAPSSQERMRNSLGGESGLDSLAGMLGADRIGGGREVGDSLSGMFGGSRSESGGGMSDLLSNVLGEAGRALGGNQNLALGGLGALVGAVLGGGGKSLGGAVGGGLMALLGAMAFNALKAAGEPKPQVPLGLLEPQDESQQKELEQNAELLVRAMINATKADSEIDQDEIDRILGRLQEMGVDDEGRSYVVALMRQPMETDGLIASARGKPELAAQMYAASLLAIEVDTPAERDYLNQLASGLGLSPQVAERIEAGVGLRVG